jgi:hypothetical protein
LSKVRDLELFERHGYENVAGEKIGRDPREMDISDLNALGHGKTPLLKAIRAKCLDCCCDQPSEVRKCTAFGCALWPFRMNANPFSERVASPAAIEALARVRVARRETSITEQQG